MSYIVLPANRPKRLAVINTGYILQVEPWGPDRTVITFGGGIRHVYALPMEQTLSRISPALRQEFDAAGVRLIGEAKP